MKSSLIVIKWSFVVIGFISDGFYVVVEFDSDFVYVVNKTFEFFFID